MVFSNSSVVTLAESMDIVFDEFSEDSEDFDAQITEPDEENISFASMVFSDLVEEDILLEEVTKVVDDNLADAHIVKMPMNEFRQ